MRLLAVAALLFVTACAAPAAQKMSFAEAFAGSPAGSAEPDPAPVAVPKAKRPSSSSVKSAGPHVLVAVEPSLELQRALTRFGAQARSLRAESPKGSSMPMGAVKNWAQLTAAIDDFLARSPRKTAPPDVVRARITADAELEMDARHYGDMPTPVAEAVLERVTRLAVRMAEVRQLRVEVARAQLRFAWPLETFTVTSLFGRRMHPMLRTWKQHQGLDLAAQAGQRVHAAAEGVVLRASENGDHGIQVELHHGPGLTTRYSHLDSALVVEGQRVKRGEIIGLAGDTGRATGVHLHFEIWKDGVAVDPLEELGYPSPTPVVASR